MNDPIFLLRKPYNSTNRPECNVTYSCLSISVSHLFCIFLCGCLSSFSSSSLLLFLFGECPPPPLAAPRLLPYLFLGLLIPLSISKGTASGSLEDLPPQPAILRYSQILPSANFTNDSHITTNFESFLKTLCTSTNKIFSFM